LSAPAAIVDLAVFAVFAFVFAAFVLVCMRRVFRENVRSDKGLDHGGGAVVVVVVVVAVVVVAAA
jgi:hypothetical protein